MKSSVAKYIVNSDSIECVDSCSKVFKHDPRRVQIIFDQSDRIYCTALDDNSIDRLEKEDNEERNDNFTLELSKLINKSITVKITNFAPFHHLEGFETKYFIRYFNTEYTKESNLPGEADFETKLLSNGESYELSIQLNNISLSQECLYATVFVQDVQSNSIRVFNHQSAKIEHIRPKPDPKSSNRNSFVLWLLLLFAGVLVIVGTITLFVMRLLKIRQAKTASETDKFV